MRRSHSHGRVAVVLSFLPWMLLAAPAELMDAPRPVSPGRADEWAVIAQRCPTFSWSAIPSAWAYEIAIYAVEDSEKPGAAADGEPLVRAEVPGNASSWTPSLDQCLEPGGRYQWFVREKGPMGRPDGEWSKGVAFQVDPTGRLDPDWDHLLEELTALQDQLESLRGKNEGRIQSMDVFDDIINKLNGIRNVVDDIFTRTGEIVVDTREIVVDTRELVTDTNQVVANVVPLGAMMSTQAVNLTPDVRDTIDEAIEEVKSHIATEKQGSEAFLGPNDCGSGSPCAAFRADLISFVQDLDTVIDTLIDPAPVTGTAVPRVDLTPLTLAIHAVPGRALNPLYRGLVVESNLLSGARLAVVKENLLACLPAVQGLGCPEMVANEQSFAACSTELTGLGVTLKLLGEFCNMLGETHLDSKMGVHGYPGIVIKNNRLKKVGALLGGVAGGVSQVSGFVTAKLRHCLILDGQSQLALGSSGLGTQLTTHDGNLATHDGKLAAHDQTVSASFLNLNGRVDGVDEQLQLLHGRIGDCDAADGSVLMEQQLASCQGLVSLMLPAAFGGDLEEVVALVRSSITQASDAGLDTNPATNFLNKANEDIAAGRYPKAFGSLCKAYQALTN